MSKFEFDEKVFSLNLFELSYEISYCVVHQVAGGAVRSLQVVVTG
jgi:hypothetical protein